MSGLERGSWKRGLFRKVHVLEILDNLEILDSRELPDLWKTKENPTIF